MQSTTSRRSVLGALGAGAALSLARETLAQEPATAEGAPPAAFRGEHQPRPLPFDPSKLRGLSERLIRSHWENNYGGSVRALNAVESRLAAMMEDRELPAYVYGDLKREELVRTGSVILHEHYFANLGGDGKAAGTARELIEGSFGSFDAWRAEFERTAGALAGGSGWVVLALNLHTGVAHNYWAWDHMHNAVLGAPLLVLDMYEHAYHMDFGAAAARYVEAFLDNVDWQEVDRRADWARKVSRG
jgi:Fe-Mn family superoxide dismutase